jgi:nucleoid DNA-binding protein
LPYKIIGGKYMNRADLTIDLAAELGISKKQAKDAVTLIFDQIAKGMVSEGKVTIVDFGSFMAVHKPARPARNPRTGEAVTVPARIVPKFKAAKALKALVRNADVPEESAPEEPTE